MTPPEDPRLEAQVVGAVLARWLHPIDVDPDVMYRPQHARLIIAARHLANRHALWPEYEIRGTDVVMTVHGLAGALASTGSATVAEDLAVGERLATAAPACTIFDVRRLEELARRRNALRALIDAHDAVLAGAPLDEALALVAGVA